MGRPKWIPDAEICARASEMASRGLTVAQIADCLGVSDQTIYERQKEYPEFLESIKRGRSAGMNQITNALFEKAVNGDNTAMIFYLKTRDRENWGEQYIEPVKEIPPINITVHPDAINKAPE
jgi:predicted DNA-binding transcriptional regulator AlpA